MSGEETIITLFDTLWFEHGVFTSNPNSFPTPIWQEEEEEEEDEAKVNGMMRKSYSDQCLSSNSVDSSPSPKSVLGPHLQTILSGKEVESFEDSSSPKVKQINLHVNISKPHGRKRRKSKRSKSLSELELEELKGFMDLGFVFSDEEKEDSRLASIIPGLQRLGKNEEYSDKEFAEPSLFRRPYLSEAWDCFEDEDRLNNPSLMDWKMPDLSANEMEIKDHIRFWAQTVASTVR